jgi:hypothetical protein
LALLLPLLLRLVVRTNSAPPPMAGFVSEACEEDGVVLPLPLPPPPPKLLVLRRR